MVLHHIAQSADLVVERAPSLRPEVLCHRDLHATHVMAVPDRFQHGVGEAEDHQVLYGFLAEEVVDPIHPFFREMTVHEVVELGGRLGVATEGLLQDQTALMVESYRRQSFNHLVEQARGNSEIGHGALAAPCLFDDIRVGRRIPVVAGHVTKVGGQPGENLIVDRFTGSLESLPSMMTQYLIIPASGCHPNHRHVEATSGGQIIESREQFPASEIASDSEQDECIGVGPIRHLGSAFSW